MQKNRKRQAVTAFLRAVIFVVCGSGTKNRQNDNIKQIKTWKSATEKEIEKKKGERRYPYKNAQIICILTVLG